MIDPAETILFYSKSAEYNWLSNFSLHAFRLDGSRWQSVEHYYQAQKYVGTDAVDRIRDAETPLKARKIGQDRSLTPRIDWEAVKEELMRRAVQAKFEQNRRLRELLVATGERELVHESSSDLFWGRNQEGAGENRLGLILMALRKRLRSEECQKE